MDDIWVSIGSDNLNRRSWTHDSEISCAILDETYDQREPRDPAGLGDGARKFARDTRLRLAIEHTSADIPITAMIDPHDWFDALCQSAHTLDAWHRDGQRGPRPPGHLRTHRVERVDAAHHGLLYWAHTLVLDPDGRPANLKHHHTY